MFRPEHDRLDYVRLLLPPEGYSLEAALGTSYSVELEYLLSVCMRLHAGGRGEGPSASIRPLEAWMALRHLEGRLLFFHDNRRLSARTEGAWSGFAHFESILVPIRMRRGEASFHPKMWLLCYKSRETEERRCRLVVMSRNLTSDRSWDVAVALEGYEAAQAPKGVVSLEGLRPMLDYLHRRIPTSVHARVQRQLMGRMMQCSEGLLWQLPRGFKAAELIPLLPGGARMDWDELGRAHQLTVITPFLTPQVIRRLLPDKPSSARHRRVLFSRRRALSALPRESFDAFEIYALREGIVEGERALEQSEYEPRPQDIHAKMYLYERGADRRLYLGSLNATRAALEYNVELLLRLDLSGQSLTTEALLDELLGAGKEGSRSPFFLLEEGCLEAADTEAESEVERMKHLLDSLCRLSCTTHLEQMPGVSTDLPRYRLCLSFDKLPRSEYSLLIRPLLGHRWQALSSEITFDDLLLTEVSDYFLVALDGSSMHRVLTLPLHWPEGSALREQREHELYAETIPDEETLLEALWLHLTGRPRFALREAIDLEGCPAPLGQRSARGLFALSLYESVLRACAERPEQILGLVREIQMFRQYSSAELSFELLGLYQVLSQMFKS